MLLEAKISYSSNLKDSTLKIWQKYCHQLTPLEVDAAADHIFIDELLSFAFVREITSFLDYSLNDTVATKFEIF